MCYLVIVDQGSFYHNSCDISGSFALDRYPFFPMPTKSLETLWPRLIAAPLEPFLQFLFGTWRSQMPEHTNLINLVVDIIPEKQHLQDEILCSNGSIWTETMYVCHHINPLLHSLLQLPRANLSSNSSLIAEALRLGSIIYLATIRYAFGISPFQSGEPVRKIKDLFEMYDHGESEQAALDFGWSWIKIWVLGCAVINRPAGPEGHWFFQRLHLEMGHLGLKTYDNFEEHIGFFLWIPEVHGLLLRNGSTGIL